MRGVSVHSSRHDHHQPHHHHCHHRRTRAHTLTPTARRIYLAYATSLCKMESLKIVVTDDGVTAISEEESANEVACAVDWVDLEAFHTHIVDRICGVDSSSPKL